MVPFMKKLLRTALLLLCLLLFSACEYSTDTVIPEDHIHNHFKNYEQLNVVEDKQLMMYLVKQEQEYNLLIFKEKESAFLYEGGSISDVPYGHMIVGTSDNTRVTVYLDNSIVKAERYEFDLSTYNDNEDMLTISLGGLSNKDTYLIKNYNFLPPYTSISQLRFYDKNGKRIDETAFLD